jgi:hypothetical protein
VSGAIDRWLGDDLDEPSFEGDVDATSIWTQLDCLAVERLERNDPRWSPADTSEAGMARLVRSRQARGLPLAPPRMHR